MIMLAKSAENTILDEHLALLFNCDRLNDQEKMIFCGALTSAHKIDAQPVAIWKSNGTAYFEYCDRGNYFRILVKGGQILFPNFPSKVSDSALAEKHFPQSIIIKFFNPEVKANG